MASLSEEQFIVEFDPTARPAVEIDPGEQVEAKVLDWCFGQVNDRPETYTRATQAPRCPAAGPIAVRGAVPGDTLVVEILEIRPESPGFMVIRPGSGPMGQRIQQTEIVRIPLDEKSVLLPSGLRVPIEPMLGVIGTAPPQGRIPTLHAGDHGGNLDTREVGIGSKVYLPVRVPGALLAFGDVHAAMGDGELSGSGVEVNAAVKVRVNLLHGGNLPRPRLETPRVIITLATHEDHEQAIRMAAEDMIFWLKELANLAFRDALMLIGAAGSLRFSQVINKPGYTIKLLLDKRLLEA